MHLIHFNMADSLHSQQKRHASMQQIDIDTCSHLVGRAYMHDECAGFNLGHQRNVWEYISPCWPPLRIWAQASHSCMRSPVSILCTYS